jgi:hypothetical protein
MNELEGTGGQKTAGERLISDLSTSDDKYRLTVLIIEAGRIADRLEKLNAILSGQQTF